ncbi:OsmC family protein [Streptomyces roseolus]|uniref:OsmC family protein n=1 Tax=Streptomyces roseolus TaxID=67358 RepID=UPI00167312DD|nr:hypothetical protein [Streptomyces roseolus]GGR53846.1 hypothetical protein GCM10010282_53630 [Streptomyces roseolus]
MTVVDDIDVHALKDTTAAVAANLQLGQVTFSVDGAWQGGCRLTAQTGALTQADERDESRVAKHAMSSDESAALLGTDTAVSPAEHLLQALTGCYAATLASLAAGQGTELRASASNSKATSTSAASSSSVRSHHRSRSAATYAAMRSVGGRPGSLAGSPDGPFLR